MKQTYNFAYRLSFNCSVFFLIGFVCECFFFFVDMCYLRSNFEASLVLPTTQRLQLKTDEINSFVINTAAYLKQKSHFNGDNWLGIAWDIRCFQKWTKGRGSFLYEFHNAHAGSTSTWEKYDVGGIFLIHPSHTCFWHCIKICYESHIFFLIFSRSYLFLWHTSHIFMSCIA